MIDLHCHILPGVDDGSDSMETSLLMAEMAEENGTRIIAATSHSNIPGNEWENWRAVYEETLSDVQNELKLCGRKLELVSGMEIFGTEDVPEKLRDGRLITINRTRYPLVEFDFGIEEDFIYDLMDRLLRDGYTPVLAHPERYDCVQHNLQNVYEWYQMGVVIQVNKDSILGRFGRRVQYAASEILRHRLAALAASDAHAVRQRTTDLAELEEALDWNYGEGCAPLLLEENPRRILEDREVLWENPIPFDW